MIKTISKNTWRALFGMLTLLMFDYVGAQDYQKLMTSAQENIQKKNFCEALSNFNDAFKTPEGIKENNPFVLYAAASSAAYCDDNKKAIDWLSQAQEIGLVSKAEEITYIESDNAFVKLHGTKEWVDIIGRMKLSVTEKKAQEDKLNKEWNASIKENGSKLVNKKTFDPKTRFALYFTKVKGQDVPYVVFVPQNYDFKKPSKLIVYLHGGVASSEKYSYDNYLVQKEPIFSVGEDLNAIVVYPFGKKDFGWVNQQEAFDNVLTAIDQVRKDFHIDKNNIVLGGMSNGGTATFYYASLKPNIFKGFFAIVPNPNVLLDKINFNNLDQGKKIISLNSKDDSVYAFKEVEAIYLKNKNVSKDWDFRAVEEGDHGLIYEPGKGQEILENVIKELLDK